MGLLSQLCALVVIGGAVVAYLHATQPETVAPLLQRIRAELLERAEWDLATVLPELAPQPEPEPAAAPTFVGSKKSKKAPKKPKGKAKPASSAPAAKEQVELRLDPTDGGWYPKASFVEVYGGVREWEAQEDSSRTVDADGSGEASGTGEPWTVVHSPPRAAADAAAGGEASGGGGAELDEPWWDEEEEDDQWETVDEAKKKRDQLERRKERAAAAAASPWAAAEGDAGVPGAAVGGSGLQQGPNDGLTKKQRENKRKAAKKKAMKEAVDAARKAGRRA